MANFKTCTNGHNYDASKSAVCPFCPGTIGNSDYEQTMVEFKKTQMMNEGTMQFDKTMINEENRDLKTTLPGASASQHPFNRTTIVSPGDASTPQDTIMKVKVLEQSEKRKMVGWLVTFSYDEKGQDYKLYMGKNKIGSAANCDIVINDSSISGEHATILFRENNFLIKDNFSTNGTKINGITIDEGKLTEADDLTLGNTIFKFKTVF